MGNVFPMESLYEEVFTSPHEKARLILIHGGGEHSGRYQWVVDQLNKDGVTVYTGDLPGHGRTKGLSGHVDYFEHYLQTVDRWIEKAKENNNHHVPIFLFGHSFGGLIASRYAQTRPIDLNGVILSSPCFRLYFTPSQWKEKLGEILVTFSPKLRLKSELDPTAVSRSIQVVEDYPKDPYTHNRVSLRWYKEFTKAMELNIKHRDDFKNIPLLVMQAGEDKIVRADVVKEWFNKLKIDNKELIIWDGLYHEILNEPERDQVYHKLIMWINGRSK